MAAYHTGLVGTATRRPVPRAKQVLPGDWFGQALRGADRLLRRRMGIEEFCADEACIIRVALGTADRDLCLADGTQIRKGNVIGELHLWNEHLPRASESETAVAWALEIRRLFAVSLALLAQYVEVDPRFRDVPAFHGGVSFANQFQRDAKVGRVMAWFGIETLPSEPTPFENLHEFGNALFTLAVIHAFHLGGLFVAAPLRRRQYEIWLSRRVLLERYSGAKPCLSDGKAAAMQKGAA